MLTLLFAANMAAKRIINSILSCKFDEEACCAVENIGSTNIGAVQPVLDGRFTRLRGGLSTSLIKFPFSYSKGRLDLRGRSSSGTPNSNVFGVHAQIHCGIWS